MDSEKIKKNRALTDPFLHGSAAVIFVMSIIVMLGWCLGNEILIRLSPVFPAMVFNTALGFFFCSSSLLGYLVHNNPLRIASSILASFIGALTLMEYASGRDLGVDELFFQDFIRTNADFPGRMSLGTSIGIAATGTTLLLLPLYPRSLFFAVFLEFMCMLVTLMAGASFLDHIAMTGQNLWVGWQSMALHTSFSLIILNSVILMVLWKERGKSISPFFFSIPLFCLVFAIIFDIHTPLGIAAGFVYTPFVLCAYWSSSARIPFIFACIGSGLTLLGLYLSTDIGLPLTHVLLNRLMAIISLFIIAGLLYTIRIKRNTLREYADTLEAIVDNTVDGLITIDTVGTILRYNKACATLFGYTADEVIGENIRILMPSPYREQHDTYLKNYQETGRQQVIGTGREVYGQKKDESIFPLHLSVSEVNIRGKKLYSGILRDITLQKKAENEILRSNEELERFAYIASHDLQEPLRMITNFTNLLDEDYGADMDNQARQYMNFITDASKRMQKLVSDLLEYSRIGSEDHGFSEFDGHQQILSVLKNLQHMIDEANTVVCIDKLPVLYTNPVRFSRLMQNLISNAVKYRAKNKPSQIHIHVEQVGNEWRFCVKDNGIGIKKEYQQKIFHIFQRLHTKNEYTGTGIGLAICKKIAESLHGQLWVESIYGEGSSFYFTLPVTKA